MLADSVLVSKFFCLTNFCSSPYSAVKKKTTTSTMTVLFLAGENFRLSLTTDPFLFR